MKKLLSLLFCLLLTAAATAPALADLIWEPMDDFYFEHYDECRLEEGTFTAEEETKLYRSPENSAPTAILAPGTTKDVGCYYTAENGDEWAYLEYYDDGVWVKGWVNVTVPGAAPRAKLQTLPVILTASALAAVTIVVLFIRPKKR